MLIAAAREMIAAYRQLKTSLRYSRIATAARGPALVQQRQQPTAAAGYVMCRLMPRSSSGQSATASSADSSGLRRSAWVK